MSFAYTILAHPEYLTLCLLLALLTKLFFNKYGHGLLDIPGPFAAPFTDLWRLFITWQRRPDIAHLRAHKQYGPIVRIGPRAVSVSATSAIPVIYGFGAGFVKSDFYTVQQTLSQGRPLFTLFTSTNDKFHAKLRRAVSSAYAMSTLVQFEPFVDSTIQELFHQLDARFTDKEQICDIGTWLQYFAFDVIGELTYSKRIGFVDKGEDVGGIIRGIEWMLDYASVVGQIPLLDRLLLKNPLRLFLSKLGLIGSTTHMVSFAKVQMADRVNETMGKERPMGEIDPHLTRRDFLSRFLEAHEKDPDFISNEQVLALTVANIFAGSDTTAISLRSIFYFLLKHPVELERLLKELRQQRAEGKFKRTDGQVDWNEVRELPVLDAVVKESLRLHPAAGLTLERIVPEPGVELCGKFIPPGTIIGCNAWTVHQDISVFGSDSDIFRPLRWVEASPERRRLMDNSLFTFGAGSRTCIGRNISFLEIYKLVPAFLMRYRLEFPHPDSTWRLHNAWFVKQSQFRVRIRTRAPP